MQFRLDLSLSFATGDEYQVARRCRAEMNPLQWTLLAQLAAEILAIHESAAAGSRVVILPAAEVDSEPVLRGLRLRPAGRE